MRLDNGEILPKGLKEEYSRFLSGRTEKQVKVEVMLENLNLDLPVC